LRASANHAPSSAALSAKMDKLVTSAFMKAIGLRFKMGNVNAITLMNPSTQEELAPNVIEKGVLCAWTMQILLASSALMIMLRLLMETVFAKRLNSILRGIVGSVLRTAQSLVVPAASNSKNLSSASHVLQRMPVWMRKDSVSVIMMMRPLTLRGNVWSVGLTGAKCACMMGTSDL
jgi:hypothetical protein